MPVPTLAEVRSAVEVALGAPVVSLERQARWRPTWFVDVERDGETLPLVVRGDRFDAESLPLRHEFTFHGLLAERGLRVPKLYDYLTIGSLDAFILERVPGKPDFADVLAEDRDTVVDEYLQQLALIHALDPAPFVVAGIKCPADGESPLGAALQRRLRRFRASKAGPDPFAEFCLGWLRRHQPKPARKSPAPCLVDTGQFHHKDGHLIAILDLEFGQLGDPMQDLAVWRMRDTLIPFGDMGQLYARYEALSGMPVDLDVIKWLHLSGAVGNRLMFAAAVAAPDPETDVMTYMQWNSETDLMASDFLGEVLGIDLPEVEPPAAQVGPDQVIHEHLVRSLRAVASEDAAAQHSLRLCFRMSRHLQRRSEIGAELDRQDVEDVAELLGSLPADWNDATARLEAFVLDDAETGRHDAALAALFHKRNLRRHMALGPSGSSMTRHYQCQRFDGKPARIVQL
ncbi:MAG TPA: phosphotransferase [Caulobacteraceae bacterium]|nr:phosphotransferase [Caulobacteraceae bacterium]